MPRSKQNHLRFKIGFRWVLLKLFSQVLHNSFSTERDYECQVLLCWILFAFTYRKKLATLNSIWVLFKSVLIDLRAHNFVHVAWMCMQFVKPCSHMMYGSWYTECGKQNFLSFWTIFCPFTPLTTWKIKILNKWKNHLEILSFYTAVT